MTSILLKFFKNSFVCGVVQKLAEAERRANELEQQRQRGKDVVYGEIIQVCRCDQVLKCFMTCSQWQLSWHIIHSPQTQLRHRYQFASGFKPFLYYLKMHCHAQSVFMLSKTGVETRVIKYFLSFFISAETRVQSTFCGCQHRVYVCSGAVQYAGMFRNDHHWFVAEPDVFVNVSICEELFGIELESKPVC